jgi:thiamine biosynthesis lipoprotein
MVVKKVVLGAITSLGCLIFLSCREPVARSTPQVIAWSGSTMGTSYQVTIAVHEVSGLTKSSAPILQETVDRELREFSDQMSTYLETSEISRFNQSLSTDWFPISEPFAEVVDCALRVSASCDGVFDITVGPLVEAWNFGPKKVIDRGGDGTRNESQRSPSAEELASARARVGYQHLSVQRNPPAIRKDLPELRIDVNAIAPGYAVDRVIRLLKQGGYANCMVEIGGEVRACGSRPGGGPWRIGIERPDQESSRAIQQVVLLQDRALATSGDYRNFYLDPQTQRRISHTIDPRTGVPITHDLASVSVLAETCMEADAWATVLNVLGAEAGMPFSIKQDFDVLFIRRTPAGMLVTGRGALKPNETD